MRFQPRPLRQLRRTSPGGVKAAAAVSALTVLLGMVVATADASAQQVFRQVDRNGKVSYSDQPPPTASTETRIAVPIGDAPSDAGGTGSGIALPYELRQVAQRFPVLLYTRDDCGPCDSGRALLAARGVPFGERQIRTPEDSAAFLRFSGQDSLPLLSIGTQQLKGFSNTTWSQYLDVAGYPKSIQLPAGYRNPPAQPLATRAWKSPTAAAPQASAPGTTALPPIPPAVTGPTPGNPAGIRF
ncbi:MAG: glutaredoxin family protein [Janthinobacterium lividum]